MAPTKFWSTYFDVFIICHLIASIIYLVGASMAFDKQGGSEATSMFVTIFSLYVAVGGALCFIRCCKTCYVLGMVFLIVMSLAQIYFFIAALADWNNLIYHIVKLEKIPFDISVFAAQNKELVIALLILGVPFYALAIVSMFVLRSIAKCC